MVSWYLDRWWCLHGSQILCCATFTGFTAFVFPEVQCCLTMPSRRMDCWRTRCSWIHSAPAWWVDGQDGEKIGETSIVKHLGEEKLKKLINWSLRQLGSCHIYFSHLTKMFWHQSTKHWEKTCKTARYFSELDIPVKRGTFIEFRQASSLSRAGYDMLWLVTPQGMLNLSPIGRNCSREERQVLRDNRDTINPRQKAIESPEGTILSLLDCICPSYWYPM